MPSKRSEALTPEPRWLLIVGILVVVGLLVSGCGEPQPVRDAKTPTDSTSAPVVADCYDEAGMNNYLVALIKDSGAQAGFLDEHQHC